MPAARPTKPTPAELSHDQDGPASSEPSRGPAAAATERYGPVALERMAKDDGRLLILYTKFGEHS
jgi:hypothetical protein